MPFRFLFLLAGALALAGCNSQKPAQANLAGPAAMPAVPVSVAPAEREVVPVEVRAVGSAEPFQTVQVKSQIAGELVSVQFAEGSQLHKGDLLFQIDPRPYEEALRQAVAAVAKDSAQLAQSEANLAHDRAQEKNARAEADRYDELFKEGIAARNQHEQIRTTFEAMHESVRADEAGIQSARASLESDRAAVETAKLNLGYCEIRSPVSGRAGNVLVHAGNLVKANGDNALVVINQIEPIFVTFACRSSTWRQSARSSARPEARGRGLAGGRPGQNRSRISDGDRQHRGFHHRHHPPEGGFRKPDRALWPGQFVNVVLTLDTRASRPWCHPKRCRPASKGSSFTW